jgi:hypothetical protein
MKNEAVLFSLFIIWYISNFGVPPYFFYLFNKYYHNFDEILKFIKRIRSKKDIQEKLIFIHRGRGHFTTSWKSRAEDIALLDNWLEQSPGLPSSKKSAVRTKNRTPKYNSMATRRNRNRASRKNRDRKNRASRKNRNNAPAMMGGRRRGSRKHGRKGSRKH